MNIDKALQAAFEYYQAGRLAEAEYAFRQILKKDHKNPEAYYYLGRILHAKGQPDEAVVYFKKVTELSPGFAPAYFSLGNIFQSQGLLDDAIAQYKRAIDLNPGVAVAYNNLGNVLQEKSQFDEAISCYEKAVQLDPNLTMAYGNLAKAYYSSGIIFMEKGQTDHAIDCFMKSLHLNPDDHDVHYNLGVLYQKRGDVDKAMNCYEEIIRRNPLHANTLNAIGSVLQEEGKIDEAEGYYRKALQINTNMPEALNNLGTVLKERGQTDESELLYSKALQVNPEFVAALNNLGTLLREKGQLEDAEMFYKRAIDIVPDFTEAHWNRAFTNLLAGNFSEGWKEYEWRWKIQDHYLPSLSQPLWDGSDIRGRTILLHAEQGLGDTIQFIRYAPLVASMGAKVIVVCQKELSRIVQTVENIGHVVAYGDALPYFEIHCPLMRLPMIFQTTLETIPVKIPYMSAAPSLVAQWKQRIRNDSSMFKIGLAWAGRPTHVDDRNRSCPLELLLPLIKLDNITLYSLQKGSVARQIENLPRGVKIIDYVQMLHDFYDTAALIENLDLVITVDTALAHLTGALGKSVWTLLRYAPDWRWLLNREDSPWYPTMRLFRQQSPGDWKGVVERVTGSIKEIEL